MELLAVNWGDTFLLAGFCLLIVFIVLTLLVGILLLFGKIMTPKIRVKTSQDNKMAADVKYDEVTLTSSESAAIATALHLYFNDNHDQESYRITIKYVERRYSPWSSKIYGLNNLHR
ncbi:MAG: OadG family protein [Bacteroidales bacterium]|jgi:Na+-transporting methylmalonyl-CoA/oxaloacetate decarboxylase gamma subunit|nr:OadG family protein [Bacteroidales bacterium]